MSQVSDQDVIFEARLARVLDAVYQLAGLDLDADLDALDVTALGERLGALAQSDPEAAAQAIEPFGEALRDLIDALDGTTIGEELPRLMRKALDATERWRTDVLQQKGASLTPEVIEALLAGLAAWGESQLSEAPASAPGDGEPSVSERLRAELEERAAARPPVSFRFEDLIKPRGGDGLS